MTDVDVQSSPHDVVEATRWFCREFQRLTKRQPFRWQVRLFQAFTACDTDGALPVRALDLPTGVGKTSVMAIWHLARAYGAPLPRRLVYVVDRRAVVDQATEVATEIAEATESAALGHAPKISTLRGKHLDNREWQADPAAPAIVVGTVDMIGSRLLFEGYGVGRRMRPIHAGLLGVDTLLVLDEAHLVPPFERLLDQIEAGAGSGRAAPPHGLAPLRCLSLSATGRALAGGVFRLNAEDRAEPRVGQRLHAAKRLRFEPDPGKALSQQLAAQAWALAGEGRTPARVLVYCTSRSVAETTRAALISQAGAERVEMLVGARRVAEREDAAGRLRTLGFFSESPAETEDAGPAFVVATAAGEVGVDLDADHAVMDLVAFERMVQRLGRVNRLGAAGRSAEIVVLDATSQLPEAIREQAENAGQLLRRLPPVGNDAEKHDASPAALGDLKAAHPDQAAAASTPEPLYPSLTRPLLDAWSMTALAEHPGRPEVAHWLRGWETDRRPQTALVWRRYLPVHVDGSELPAKEIERFFDSAPVHLAETLETETDRVRDWLKAHLKAVKRADKLQPPEAAVAQAADGETVDAVEGAAPVAPRSSADPDAAVVAGDTGDTGLAPPLATTAVVAVALGPASERRGSYTWNDLARLIDNRGRFDATFAGTTLVLDARLGGLGTQGLLEVDAKDRPDLAADGADGWPQPAQGDHEASDAPLVPFRVRRLRVNTDEEGADVSAEARTDPHWRPAHWVAVARDGEGRPTIQLQVEAWPERATSEDSRSLTRRPQRLDAHQDQTAKIARDMADRLGLEADLAEALEIAARLHDSGKAAPRWQRAFHIDPNVMGPLAKTGSRRPPDQATLGGYRHEFGSLFHVENADAVQALPEEMRDLVLHLVAAHHGHARPIIPVDGCDAGPPSQLERKARDVALRFTRLQARYGPWVLAWLEALLRAADHKASRDHDIGETPDG